MSLTAQAYFNIHMEPLWVIVQTTLPIGAKADYVSSFDGHPALQLALGVAVSVSGRPTFRGWGPFRPNNVQAIVDIDKRRVIVCCRNADIYL
jgi:hypothetical protein